VEIEQTLKIDDDGVDRRGFLKCMAWAGTGVVWSMHGGLLRGTVLGDVLKDANARHLAAADFSFVQISDSHIGFSKAANPDVTKTFEEAIGRIHKLQRAPEFLIHTGDVSHLSKPDEFDAVDQMLKGADLRKTFYVPGEHDLLDEGSGKLYMDRFGRSSKGAGWYSFDVRGIHFVGLVNVVNLKSGGLGNLGTDQLTWLKDDLASLSASTPIVVFAHIPLWSVYPDWGWGTADAEQALALLKRFGSVTVLNGHIHQTLQKVEGNITFHTAASTAFPQPEPGKASSPGPMTVEPGRLRDLLGITAVNYNVHQKHLAVIDIPLSSAVAKSETVTIDNFTFRPAELTVNPGTSVTWVNRDDIPHNIVSTDNSFHKSPPLDTGEKFSHTFEKSGVYHYICGIHPQMKGVVTVR
jgi:plastocyanin